MGDYSSSTAICRLVCTHLQRSTRRSFAPLQKSPQNHCSYVLTETLPGMVFVPAPKLSGTVRTLPPPPPLPREYSLSLPFIYCSRAIFKFLRSNIETNYKSFHSISSSEFYLHSKLYIFYKFQLSRYKRGSVKCEECRLKKLSINVEKFDTFVYNIVFCSCCFCKELTTLGMKVLLQYLKQ